MKIVRMKLTPDDLGDPNIRYNDTTHTTQFSPDGGTTWTDAPTLDARHANTFRKPTLTGSDIRCRAAANMIAAVKARNDAFISSTGQAGLLTEALAVTLLIGLGAGWILALIVETIAALELISSAVVNAAFTSGVYADLECIFFCNIGIDGSMTAAQATTIQSAIASAHAGTVSDVMALYFTEWGEVGFSNAGTVGSAAADCSSCYCGSGCNGVDDPATYTVWQRYSGVPIGSLDSGFGNPAPSVKSGTGSDGGYPAVVAGIEVIIPAPSTVTTVTFDIYNGTGSGTSGVSLFVNLLDASHTIIQSYSAVRYPGLSAWTNETFAVSGAGVKYIQVGTGNNYPGLTGNHWLDNVCWS